MTASFDSFETYQGRRRCLNLGGLRFICISAVLWHHAGFRFAEHIMLSSRGFLGVDFFFVLSGYLITTLLLREESRDGAFSFKGFYWRRFLRIIPLYAFVVTLCTLYFGVVQGDGQALERAPFYYLFLSNFLTSHTDMLAPTWSLSVEEQFYVVWPLLLAFVPRKHIATFVIVSVLLNLASAMGLFGWLIAENWQAGLFELKLPNATYAPILMGSLVAILLHSKGTYDRAAQLLGRAWMPVILGVAILVMAQVFPEILKGWPQFFIHIAMSAFIIAIVTKEQNVMTPFLTLKPVVRVGEISYGIYLYHLIGLHIASILLKVPFDRPAAWMKLIVMYVVTVVIAEISFRTIEAFFRQFRNKPPFFLAEKKAAEPTG